MHHTSAGDRADQDRRRRLRQAVLGHVQGVLGQDAVPRRRHCPDPSLYTHLQVCDKHSPLLVLLDYTLNLQNFSGMLTQNCCCDFNFDDDDPSGTTKR